jgi:hypothetical protein
MLQAIKKQEQYFYVALPNLYQEKWFAPGWDQLRQLKQGYPFPLQ